MVEGEIVMENEIFYVKRNEGAEGVRTAFVFSCPGQEELKSGKLVNGQTGKNLDMMLEILNKEHPDIFPYTDRYSYRITNSSERVHYKAHDNRSEPKKDEILAAENLSRLMDDIRDYKYIITFGRCASLAVEAAVGQFCNDDKVIMYSQHLSFLSLNSSIKEDINGEPILRGSKDSTYKRLQVAARKICEQMKSRRKE